MLTWSKLHLFTQNEDLFMVFVVCSREAVIACLQWTFSEEKEDGVASSDSFCTVFQYGNRMAFIVIYAVCNSVVEVQLLQICRIFACVVDWIRTPNRICNSFFEIKFSDLTSCCLSYKIYNFHFSVPISLNFFLEEINACIYFVPLKVWSSIRSIIQMSIFDQNLTEKI